MRITHGFVHQEIITLINEAEQFLILITPYLMPWTGLTIAIERPFFFERRWNGMADTASSNACAPTQATDRIAYRLLEV